ncbi:MAG: TonB-dependent receptor plug domain-containing protein [Ignavibacteriae bacterium]|nr:TonB-dependent receptor plug domain-containing protein [Ignavibacteriota bacterium]
MRKVLFISIIILIISYSYSLSDNNSDTTKVFRTPSITVTTTRALTGISPVPFSEMSKDVLMHIYNVRDIPDVISELPSIFSYSQNGNSIGYTNLTMRGFDQRRISVMINGIPQNDPEDHQVYWIDFPDIGSNLDNIQVQRGAGLINYGAAAIGGSINLTTSNFTKEKGITLYSGIGYQEYTSGSETAYQPTLSKFSLEVSSGMVDKYAFYGRLSKINSEGYRDRSWTYMNSYFLSGARFDKNFSTQINIFGGPITDGLAYTGLPKAYVTDPALRRSNPNYWNYDTSGSTVEYIQERRKQESEEFSQPHYELLNDWYISESLTFKSALFYYSGKGYYDYDGTWADGYLTGWLENDNYKFRDSTLINSLIRATVDNSQGGWIPRLLWDHGTGILTVGAELRIHRSEHWSNIIFSENLPENFNPDYNIYYYNGKRNIFSFFARESYNINEKLMVSGEVQVVNQSFAISGEKAGNNYTKYLSVNGDTVGNGATLFDINHFFINPRIGLNYNFNGRNNLYFLGAYTSREQRMRNFYPADDIYFGGTPLFEGDTLNGTRRYDFTKPIVKPESMLDFEIGFNTKGDDYNFSFNLYWMEYFDELVKSGRVDIFGNPVDGNAPRTRHFGIEMEGFYNVIDKPYGKFSISGNFTYSQNKIIEYDYITSLNEKISLTDNPIAGFPDFISNIRLSYIYKDFYISLLAKSVGGFFGEKIGEFRSDNYGDLINSDTRLKNQLLKDYNYYIDNNIENYFTLNADISYTFSDILSLQRIKLHAQIINLLNRLYAGGAEGKEFFPAAERSIFLGIELGI